MRGDKKTHIFLEPTFFAGFSKFVARFSQSARIEQLSYQLAFRGDLPWNSGNPTSAVAFHFLDWAIRQT